MSETRIPPETAGHATRLQRVTGFVLRVNRSVVHDQKGESVHRDIPNRDIPNRDIPNRGNTNTGVDGGLGQGMEMALTVAVFLGLGWALDTWLETRPVFMVIFVVFAMIGQSVRMWVAYDLQMRTLENERMKRATQHQHSDRAEPEQSHREVT